MEYKLDQQVCQIIVEKKYARKSSVFLIFLDLYK